MNFNLDHSVNHRIATVATLLKRQVFRIIAENKLEITPEQWVLLYYLWNHDGLSIGELVTKSKKDYANVTRIVDKLIKSGYLEKRKSEIDSRKSNLFILPKALEIKDQITKCWKASTAITLNGISEEEQQSFLKTLQKIEDNIFSANKLD